LNDSLNNISVENWNYHSIPNECGFTNGIKVIPVIHDSESYVTKIIFFDGNVTLSNEFQTESRESKVTPIVLRENNL